MRHGCSRRRNRGTSLVEALVALAVMAFGMLAVVGIQATLRLNADVAKQRSEAVRIAQEAMEAARSFSTIDTAVGQVAYADVASVTDLSVVGYTTNTSYTLTQTVVPRNAPDHKELRIRVKWTDRNGVDQLVELNSVIGANDPLVSRAIGAQPLGIPVRQPFGRNPAIPPQAVSVGGGLSAFKPPSADGLVVWVFNDLTGVIVGVCNTVSTDQADLTGEDVEACINNANGLPLSGFVRFATNTVDDVPIPPTKADAEKPTSTALNLAVDLTLTSTGNAICFAAAPATATAAEASTVVPYFCAIFFKLNVVPLWSGTSLLRPLAFVNPADSQLWTIAVDLLNAPDTDPTHYRVCRYTPVNSDDESIPNQLHPRSYRNVRVDESLTNQNFLVIRAGDGLTKFHCPPDVPANPAAGDLVNSNTLLHQPEP